MIRKATRILVSACVLLALAVSASASDRGTKDEAVAMVKKAVDFIKANGNDKAFVELSAAGGSFCDRDLYVVVYSLDGKCLAHGANKYMIGMDLHDAKDPDGRLYVQDRIDLMKKSETAWQAYKFRNPVTRQIEPKNMYMERCGDLIVGCGVYGN